MEKLIIQGGNALKGEVKISGAKNAALPIMAASLLMEGECYLKNIPQLTDIKIMGEILQEVGAKLKVGENELKIDASYLIKEETSAELVSKLRASILFLSPLLFRKGKAKVALPGGCNIGSRPVDLHLKGLSRMGVNIEVKDGHIIAKNNSFFKGNSIHLDFPSVGATENLLLAASVAKGKTIIENASKTPEVIDLCNFLEKAGAKIEGIGTSVLIIEGKDSLSPVEYSIISDRIETGTFIIAAGITGGEVLIKDAKPEYLATPISKLKNMGMQIEIINNKILAKGYFPVKPVKIRTMPHPGFPTDLQPQLTSLACIANGESHIIETIFEKRFWFGFLFWLALFSSHKSCC